MPKKNSNSLYIAALVLFLGGLGYLVFSNATEGTMYSIDVAEALAMPHDKPTPVRLFGKINPNGLTMLEEGVGVRFQLEDKNNATQVLWTTYKGALPDSFVPGAHIYVEGNYTGPNQVFVAQKLMTQCPSKYEEKVEELKKG